MSTAVHLLRAWLRDDSGATAAEFAAVIPLALTLIFGTISTCMMMAAVTSVQFAAQKTARCQAVNVSGSCPVADTYAKTQYGGPALTGLTFAGSDQTCGRQVTGSGSYTFFPGFKASTVSISAKACYPKPVNP